jgi:hypothetical protein
MRRYVADKDDRDKQELQLQIGALTSEMRQVVEGFAELRGRFGLGTGGGRDGNH